jgi:imidazolonepropionase-like amidohydrolase
MTLAIVGATLSDAVSTTRVRDALVLVEGDRINYAGPRWGAPQIPDGAEVLDGTGRYLIPGLINCHDHIFQKRPREAPVPSGDRLVGARAEGHAALALRSAYNARDELAQGVTTTRDMGTPGHVSIALRDAIDAGLCIGPRIIASGEAVTMTGGHFHEHSRQADGPDAVRAAVREQLRAGADCIKLMASGGIAGWPREEPGQVEYTPAELRAGVEEAHKRGRRVAAHAMIPEAVRNALEAGVDTIEHGFLVDRETVRLIATRGAAFVPTLNVSNRRYRPRPRGDRVATALELHLNEAVVPVHRDAFRAAAEAGVLIGAGTDSRGYLWEELALMVEYGFSPREAVLAATTWAAALCGCESDRGTVEAGKRADLLLCAQDPTADVLALRGEMVVIKGGALVSRQEPRPTLARGHADAPAVGPGTGSGRHATEVAAAVVP